MNALTFDSRHGTPLLGRVHSDPRKPNCRQSLTRLPPRRLVSDGNYMVMKANAEMIEGEDLRSLGRTRRCLCKVRSSGAFMPFPLVQLRSYLFPRQFCF